MNEELTAMAHKAGATEMRNGRTTMGYDFTEAELAEFAALIADYLANVANNTGGMRSGYVDHGRLLAAQDIEAVATRWRSTPRDQ